MDTGLLILRLVIGGLLAAHGSQKLFGLFGGYGLTGTGGFFSSVGFRPGKTMAIVAGLSELVAGLMLVLGLLTPLASAAVIGTLVVAGSVHWAQGLWGTNGGYELPLLYAVAGGALAFTGPGEFSLDAALGIADLAGTRAGGFAVAAGLLGALIVVTRARLTLLEEASAAATHETVAA